MTAFDVRRRILYEAGADPMPGKARFRRRAFWRLWAAWTGVEP